MFVVGCCGIFLKDEVYNLYIIVLDCVIDFVDMEYIIVKMVKLLFGSDKFVSEDDVI